MEILGFMLIGVILIGIGFFIIKEIWEIFRDRKTVDKKLGEQRIRDITAALPQNDLANMIAKGYMTYTIPFAGVPVPKKKWVTPHIVEEPNRRLEFTGIRAIQL